MKVSVALCTYNGEKFLGTQLESFLSQTRLPDELVVCDDLSSDLTTEIVDSFIAKAPFKVRLNVNELNLGSTKNFEKAISLCSGEIIFLSDQDDVWFPGKIERIVEEFERGKNIGMVFSDAELADESLRSLNRKLCDFSYPRKNRGRDMFDLLLRQNFVTGATMAFRKSSVEKFLPIPGDIPNLIHDAWIALVIASSADLRFIDETLIKYRQHAGQQLGIGIGADKSYSKSIVFFENEIKRLERLKELFATDSRFSNVERDNLIESYIAEKKEIIAHYEARDGLSEDLLLRLGPIFDELIAGRYRRYSSGVLSAAKDLLKK